MIIRRLEALNAGSPPALSRPGCFSRWRSGGGGSIRPKGTCLTRGVRSQESGIRGIRGWVRGERLVCPDTLPPKALIPDS